MILATALLLALHAELPLEARFRLPVPIQLDVSEDMAPGELAELAALPDARIHVLSRSNMLRTALWDALGALKVPVAIQLRPPLRQAHLEQFPRKALRVGAVIEWPSGPAGSGLAQALSLLGPRLVSVRLVQPLDEAAARGLSSLRQGEIELSMKGRVVGAEELARLKGLRLRRAVRLDASATPQLVAALAVLRPVQIVVESQRNRLPAALSEALVALGQPVRVLVGPDFSLEDARALVDVPGLSLELSLAGAAPRPALAELLVQLQPPGRR